MEINDIIFNDEMRNIFFPNHYGKLLLCISHIMLMQRIKVLLPFVKICFRLNELLDGGLYTSEVTEIAGEISSGKTQVRI